jgi:hypothetical protein
MSIKYHKLCKKHNKFIKKNLSLKQENVRLEQLLLSLDKCCGCEISRCNICQKIYLLLDGEDKNDSGLRRLKCCDQVLCRDCKCQCSDKNDKNEDNNKESDDEINEDKKLVDLDKLINFLESWDGEYFEDSSYDVDSCVYSHPNMFNKFTKLSKQHTNWTKSLKITNSSYEQDNDAWGDTINYMYDIEWTSKNNLYSFDATSSNHKSGQGGLDGFNFIDNSNISLEQSFLLHVLTIFMWYIKFKIDLPYLFDYIKEEFKEILD